MYVCIYMCICIFHMYGDTFEGQKREEISLKLELQEAVSHPLGVMRTELLSL